MDGEILSFPDRSRTPDTQEWLIQNDERVGRNIDAHLDTWGREAQSRHPTLQQGGLSHHIIQQCSEPPEETLSPNVQQKRHLLQQTALNSTLDTFPISHPQFAEYFQKVAVWQKNPNTPAEYREVTQYLYRLFVMREQIAIQRREADFGQINFSIVLNRLSDELF